MYKFIYSLIILSCLVSCSQQQVNNGIFQEQIDRIEKMTKPVNASQFKTPQSQGEFLYAVKMFVRDGQIQRDQISMQRVPGKYSKTSKRKDFRIVGQTADNERLFEHFQENIFMIRSCDEKGQVGYTPIPNGWVEVYLPANNALSKIVFEDMINKTSQIIDIESLKEIDIKQNRK